MSEAVHILIDQIDCDRRLRPASEPHVEMLIASISRAAEAGIGHDGLREPIEVCPLESGIDKKGRGYALISGLHRLEACRRLGRDSIAAVEYDIGQLEADLLEVEENLVRADLNALDRAFFVKRFREMFEAAYGVVERGGDQSSNVELWSEAAQERLGLGKTASHRNLRIANGLHPQAVARLRGTGWDENQKALLELAGIPTEQQAVVLDRLLDPENPCQTMREAITNKPVQPQDDVNELKFRAALKVFGTAKAVRRRFYAEALISDIDEMRASFEANGYRLEPINEAQG